MRNDSFTLRFFLNTRKQSVKDKFPVFVRIIINRQKAEICTRQHLTIADWDVTTQRAKKSSHVNASLTKIEASLRQIYEGHKYNNKSINAAGLKETFLKGPRKAPSLLAFIDQYFREELTDNKILSPNTVKNYKSTIQHVKSFLAHKDLLKISLDQLNSGFVKKLDNYLQNVQLAHDESRNLKRNTINKYHIKFKTMLNKAIEDGYIETNPYGKMSLNSQETSRVFLTRPELLALERHSLANNASLLRVRDIFLFSVYTGIRYSDAMSLRAENLESDGTKTWLSFRQQKTHEIVRIPLLKRAEEICEKYFIQRVGTGYILPRISNQKLNVYLKTIAELVGIKKTLTHHAARHTNATTIFLANGVAMEVVSKQLGHRSLKTTQIYAKITNDLLSQAADKINALLE
jgi:integrase/recombinase XerD